MSVGIKLEKLNEYRKNYLNRKENKIVAQAIQKNGLVNACFNTEEAEKLTDCFNIEVKDMASVTEQKKTGRCWMFSSLNIIRNNIAASLGLKDLELSESFLFFYDKLEKCNYRLQLTIDYIKEDEDSRIMEGIIAVSGNFDGGYWHYFKELVKKYGIVPKSVMGETVPSSNSAEMDKVLNILVSKDATLLREAYKNGKSIEDLTKMKDDMMDEIYRLLGMCIGLPKDEFTFEYRKSESNEFVRIHTTPLEFFNKFVTLDLDDFIVCVSHKSDKYPFYKRYQNEFAKNMAFENYSVLNLPIEELKKYAVNCLKDNQPVFFACDVLIYATRDEGILSRKVINLDETLGIDFSVDKFARLTQKSSFWNHAMTLTGVNVNDEGKIDRWKIQNSWGTEVGKKGIFVCDDDWFDEFVYQVMVPKKYLSKEALKALEEDSIKLNYWEHIA